MSITTWLWGTSQLDDAVDKATSELLPTGAEDIALNLEICDQIRSKSVSAKEAMRALKRRLNHKNPNVQLLALALTDVCIKNGGDHFLVEVASREFIDNLVSILKVPTLNLDVKTKILRLVQNWAVAFEGKATLSYVGQVFKTLKSEGYTFPPQDMAVANAAMVDTQTAPEWIDSDVCLRCRTAFSFTNRKHHCRNCGQVFDQACSSKAMALPHFGITQEVRVCDGCYAKLYKNPVDKVHRRSGSVHSSRHRTARELADAELQRAIQLSLEEAGFANPQSRRPGYVPYESMPSEPPLVDRSSYPSDRKSPVEEDEDPDLKAAIEASLREANAPRPSAPVAVEAPRSDYSPYANGDGPGYSQSYPPASIPAPSVNKVPNYDLEPLESDAILTFSQTIEQVQAQGGRDISRYPAVNELFDKANGLRPKLAMSLDDAGRKEQMLSDMHDKLSQAVKLYDHLLTEQVSHPVWRSPQATPTPTAYHQPMSPYGQPYEVPNGYSQWGPTTSQPIAPSSDYAHDPRQAQPPQSAYPSAPPPQAYTQPGIQYTNADAQYQGQQRYAQPEQERQTWYPQQSQFAEASHQPQYGQQPAQVLDNPPSHSQPPVPISQYNNVPSAPPPTSSTYHAAPSAPTPTPQSPPPATPSHAFAIPPAQAPVSAPISATSLPPAVTSSLARHNTVAYGRSPPSNYLSRSNTVAQAPPAHSQYASAPPEPALPSFPVAPTSAPQIFPMYGSSLPNSPPTERKEALLIDL